MVRLALLGAVQFMVVLDIAIVNVALPSIQADLGFSQANLQWVISAYALVFGGFLLLGGRTADLLGRRRVFIVGLVVFTIGSLLCGLAWSRGVADRSSRAPGPRRGDDLARRARDPDDDLRRRSGAEHRPRRLGRCRRLRCRRGRAARRRPDRRASWEWIFFVNIPVGSSRSRWRRCCSRESRDARVAASTCPGASSSRAAVDARARDHPGRTEGWSSAATIGVFAARWSLLGGFVAWENRVTPSR